MCENFACKCNFVGTIISEFYAIPKIAKLNTS